jgi:hypothetical protein
MALAGLHQLGRPGYRAVVEIDVGSMEGSNLLAALACEDKQFNDGAVLMAAQMPSSGCSEDFG